MWAIPYGKFLIYVYVSFGSISSNNSNTTIQYIMISSSSTLKLKYDACFSFPTRFLLKLVHYLTQY